MVSDPSDSRAEKKNPTSKKMALLHATPEESGTVEEPPKALTAEEQMALYEERLKEDDWGHQPC